MGIIDSMKHPLRMFIDHYIQADLTTQLTKATRPLRFSELKDDGIDNSLFMYHANKLIARGIIAKTDEGFLLTQNGARWVNSIGADMVSIKPTPRALVQLVVVNEKGEILLSVRRGRLGQLLNEYMLPGGLHHVGRSADENAVSLLSKWFPDRNNNTPQFISSVENISRYSDDFIYHSISQIYEVKLAGRNLPAADDRFEFLWVKPADIASGNPRMKESRFLPVFISKWQTGTLQLREVIKIDY